MATEFMAIFMQALRLFSTQFELVSDANGQRNTKIIEETSLTGDRMVTSTIGSVASLSAPCNWLNEKVVMEG